MVTAKLSHYQRLLASFSKHKVDYVMVGVDGFNQWVPDGQSGIETTDADVAFRGDAKNILRILQAIREAKDPQTGDNFIVVATDGLAARELDLKKMKQEAAWLVRTPWTLVVEMPGAGYHFEMLRDVTGFTYQELSADAVVMDRRMVPIRVAQLEKILESKRAANRPKDLAFFKKYALLIDDAIRSARARANGLRKDLTPRKIGPLDDDERER